MDQIKPPIMPENYWSQQLDDAKESGYIDGYIQGEQIGPTKLLVCFLSGVAVGIVLSLLLLT